jgi:hypothetical protein
MGRFLSGQSQIETVLKQQMLKILGSLLALALLVGWAHEFVWSGIRSNIYLNGTIILVFLFGVSLVLRSIWALRNEDVAFSALQEAFEDSRQERVQGERDPYWRHQRGLKPGRVFGRPVVLGHMFEITYDELIRSKDIRISVSTMQNIVQGIDTKLGEQVMELIVAEVKGRETAAVIVTHDARMTHYADRSVAITDGHLAA